MIYQTLLALGSGFVACPMPTNDKWRRLLMCFWRDLILFLV
jgi:hypothetical protein